MKGGFYMFLEIRKQINTLLNNNHREFIKALISIEKNIENEKILNDLYDYYMDNDEIELLNEKIDGNQIKSIK